MIVILIICLVLDPFGDLEPMAPPLGGGLALRREASECAVSAPPVQPPRGIDQPSPTMTPATSTDTGGVVIMKAKATSDVSFTIDVKQVAKKRMALSPPEGSTYAAKRLKTGKEDEVLYQLIYTCMHH